MLKAKQTLKKVFSAEVSLLWLIVATTVFFGIVRPNFLGINNLMTILKNASYMSLMVLGLTWVIAANEMDCGFPDVAACASMVFAYLAYNGFNLYLAIIVAMASGIVFGLITSFFVIKLKFHSLITTIAISVVAKSVAAMINGGMPLNVPVIKSSGLYKFFNFNLFAVKGGFSGIPVVFLIVLAIYAVLYIIQERTKYGQYIYAMGENRQAIKEAGVKDGKILTSIFVTSSFFAALAGILMVFVVYGGGQPKMGSSFFLDGFTVVFLGAMVLKLGKTNVVGTFLGGILLTMIVNGLTMLGGTYATSQIVKGILLVIGIVMVAISQKKRRGKAGVLKYE